MWTCTTIGIILIIFIGLIIRAVNPKSRNHDSIMIILTVLVIILTCVSLDQTKYIQKLTLNDVPEFPVSEYRIDIVRTYCYIDSRFNNNTIYEVDYLVKYSKMNPPDSYNLSIFLPFKVGGFISVSESRGLEIENTVDAPNNTVEIINENKINPLPLYFVYVSEKNIDQRSLIRADPLPDIENNSISHDSFFVKIRNIGEHDIKSLTLHSNVTNWINVCLIQLDNSSWIEQPIMIYDNGLPVQEKTTDNKGNITWEIYSINSGEQKIYYFKKLNESTYKM